MFAPPIFNDWEYLAGAGRCIDAQDQKTNINGGKIWKFTRAHHRV